MKKNMALSYFRTAGVDEVGVGALAGDVVSSAVILDPNSPIIGLNDSKKLSEKKRNILSKNIIKQALNWSIGRVSCQEVDKLRIFKAIELSMIRAILNLKLRPKFLFIDGVRGIDVDIPFLTVVKGDQLVPEISAASILAKVTRDRSMLFLDKVFPNYNFSKNKGYPTYEHFCAIKKYGYTCYHRLSFKLKK